MSHTHFPRTCCIQPLKILHAPASSYCRPSDVWHRASHCAKRMGSNIISAVFCHILIGCSINCLTSVLSHSANPSARFVFCSVFPVFMRICMCKNSRIYGTIAFFGLFLLKIACFFVFFYCFCLVIFTLRCYSHTGVHTFFPFTKNHQFFFNFSFIFLRFSAKIRSSFATNEHQKTRIIMQVFDDFQLNSESVSSNTTWFTELY
jgi:hypothetical protein